MSARTVEGFALRRASVSDAALIVAHRRAMFHAQGYRDEAALNAMALKFLPWLEGKMRAGEYLAWLAVSADEEKVAAGAGLWLMTGLRTCWVPALGEEIFLTSIPNPSSAAEAWHGGSWRES